MICGVTNSPISHNYNCYRRSCQSWIRYVFGKLGNNRSKIGVRGFFCFVVQNGISDLFGIKMGFARLGLRCARYNGEYEPFFPAYEGDKSIIIYCQIGIRYWLMHPLLIYTEPPFYIKVIVGVFCASESPDIIYSYVQVVMS